MTTDDEIQKLARITLDIYAYLNIEPYSKESRQARENLNELVEFTQHKIQRELGIKELLEEVLNQL